MKHNHFGHTFNHKMLSSLGKIMGVWRGNVFFFAHLGYSQWDVEAPSQRAKSNKVQSLHSANTRT